MCSLLKFTRLALIAGCLVGTFSQDILAQTSGTGSAARRSSNGSTGTAAKGATTQSRTAPLAKGTTKVAGAPGRAALDEKVPAADGKRLPPAAKPFRIPKLTPEMEDILIEWEEKSSKITRLEGKYSRITYDGVFAVEQHAMGKFCFKYPDQGSLQQVGVRMAEGTKGRKYPAKSAEPERWVCDGKRILKIDDQRKEFEEVQIPVEDQGQNIRNSPLPFVFGMKAEEAKRRYAFELVPAGTNEHQVQLKVYPLLQQDLANYKSAEVILDRATFVPTAVKLHDVSGAKEDVYSFPKKDLTVNDRSWKQWLSGDPLKPELGNYRKMVEPAGAAGVPAGTQLAPRPTDRRSAQAPATGKTATARTAPQRTAQLPDDEEAPRISTKGKARLSP